MRHLTLLAALLVSMTLQAQVTTPSTQASLSAESIELLEKRTAEIDKEIHKLERSEARNERLIQSKAEILRTAERELEYIKKAQEENVQETAYVKSQMDGLDYEALQEKIDRLEKERSKQQRKNNHAANAIVRKKAQIEKLLAEIDVLESQIDSGEDVIDEKTQEIHDTQEQITNNALEAKYEKVNELADELSSLKAKQKREEKKIANAQDAIADAESDNRSAEQRKEALLNEKKQNESRLRSGTTSMN